MHAAGRTPHARHRGRHGRRRTSRSATRSPRTRPPSPDRDSRNPLRTSTVVRHLPRPNAACAASSRSPVRRRSPRSPRTCRIASSKLPTNSPVRAAGTRATRPPTASESSRRATSRMPREIQVPLSEGLRSRAAPARAIPPCGPPRPCHRGRGTDRARRHRLHGRARLSSQQGCGGQQLQIRPARPSGCARASASRSHASRQRWSATAARPRSSASDAPITLPPERTRSPGPGRKRSLVGEPSAAALRPQGAADPARERQRDPAFGRSPFEYPMRGPGAAADRVLTAR